MPFNPWTAATRHFQRISTPSTTAQGPAVISVSRIDNSALQTTAIEPASFERGMAKMAILSLALLLGLAGCTESTTLDGNTPKQPAIPMETCRIEGFGGFGKVKALCGKLAVPLDYSQPDGESIELFVARVPGLKRQASSHAFTVIAGGPGQSSTEGYVSLLPAFQRVRQDQDILLVDQRGTGRSSKQQCSDPGDESSRDPQEWSPEETRKLARLCLLELGENVRYYTTSAAVRDLDAVRAAFGYQQLDIYGVSYGTRVAQHYLRRYPEQSRTVVLDGVIPVNQPLGPAIALDAQRALESIFARCNSDTTCATQFGNIGEKFDRLLASSKENRLSLRIPDPISGEMIDADFGYSELLTAVRLMTYSSESAALLPLMIDQAESGNLQPMAAQALLTSENLSEMLAIGMHNSVVCTEDVPFYQTETIDTAALERTFMGDLAYRGLIETCKVWPSGPRDEGFSEPFESNVPVLIMSGENDPVTPALNGETAAEYLGNALALSLPGQGHTQVHLGCMPRLVAEFVRTGNHSGLDAECLEQQTPAPFFITPSGPAP